MLLRAFWLLLLLIGFNSSYAGMFDDEEARRQIAAQRASIGELRDQGQALESRLVKLEEVLNAQPLLELHSQIENLRLALNKLQGQIEVLVNENELAQKRQRDFYVDLDNRLRRIEHPDESAASAPGAPTSAVSETTVSQSSAPESGEPAAVPGVEPNSSAEAISSAPAQPALSYKGPSGASMGSASTDNADSRAYESGYDLFKAGKYKDAVSSFNNFLKTYPESNLAPSAHYWIGNSYYALRDFKNAISAQEKLIKSYPDSAKAPDAMLNIASSQQEINQKAAARKTLESVIAKYPGSEAAEKAKRRLVNIK